jgi:hypothetical protein
MSSFRIALVQPVTVLPPDFCPRAASLAVRQAAE